MDFAMEYINKKQFKMSVHHSTHPTCQECYNQGLMPERINLVEGMVTAAYVSPFYDGEGKLHNHDTNRHTEELKCSNGHEFTRVIPHKCWCGWKQENE